MKPNKIILIYSFVVCLLLTFFGVLSAKNMTQLFSSFIFLPLIFYFGTKILHFSDKAFSKSETKKKISNFRTVHASLVESTPVTEPKIIPGVTDNNKRLFLKLIGSTSFSIMLMALFTKKAQASFFGSVPGPGVISIKDIAGNKIDPAEKSPTDGYEITNIDDAGSTSYYGFVKKSGDWYIMNHGSTGAYRYVKGANNFATGWDNRADLTYDYFNIVFG